MTSRFDELIELINARIVVSGVRGAGAYRDEMEGKIALLERQLTDLKVSAYRKALEGVVEKYEESEPGREDFSVPMCEIAKNALDDTNEKCGANMDGVGGSNHYWCENPKPCSTHPTNESGDDDVPVFCIPHRVHFGPGGICHKCERERGDDVLRGYKVSAEFLRKRANEYPGQHEQPTKGTCTYNWMTWVAGVLEEEAANKSGSKQR